MNFIIFISWRSEKWMDVDSERRHWTVRKWTVIVDKKWYDTFLEHMVAFHVQLVPWGACSFSVLYFRTCSIFENHVFAHQVINLDHSWSIINRSKYEKFYHMFNHMFYFMFRAYFSNGKILICGNFSDWRRKCENTRISKIM